MNDRADDLAQLQSRVEAAKDRLGGVEADQRKYGLRLDDLVRIVEGALSRQSADLQAARIKSASLETELDDARNTISRHELDLAGKDTDIARLELQNEQLRGMVMTLLELVEGRSTTPLREAMVRLERGVRHLLTETASARPRAAAPAPMETAPMPQPTAPTRPVLVPSQPIEGRVPLKPATPEPAAPAAPKPTTGAPEIDAAEIGEALIELTSLGRGSSEETVPEPPEAPAARPVAQFLRRAASDTSIAEAISSEA